MTLEQELIDIVLVFVIAGGVGALTAKYVDLPYTIALLITGLIFSFLGLNFGIELSHDLIILVLLPPLLFEGAQTTDIEVFKSNTIPIFLISVVGLLISILFLGLSVHWLFGLPILISLLFASIVLPTDPVSVLALFKELGAPERLSVLVEGESLVNDGVSVVIYTTLLGLIAQGVSVEKLYSYESIFDIFSNIGLSVVGGLLAGLLIGYLGYLVMCRIDDDMTEIIITICLAYGSFLVAEHYFHVSGVLATVAVGLFIGNRGSENAMSATTKLSVFNTWETASFIVNTFIFISIGLLIPLSEIIKSIKILIPIIILVLVARAIIVYPLSELSNLITRKDISRGYQHVLVWGGLHASIPIALALGIPPSVEHRTFIQTMVFGVAGFSLIVQGLTIDNLLEKLGIVGRTKEEKMYEKLIGLGRVLDSAIEEIEKLYDKNEISQETYEKLKERYSNDKEKTRKAISSLLQDNSQLYNEQRKTARRRVYKTQKEIIYTSIREGIISEEIGDELLSDVNIKLDTIEEENEIDTDKEETFLKEAKEMGLLEEESEEETEEEDD